MALLRVALLFFLFFSHAFGEPQKIISLAPNVTETLYEIGAGDKIVGVSDFCSFPPEVKSKPKVGGMLNPSYEKILSLAPDLVIISREGTPLEVYDKLINLGLKVHVFNPNSIFNLKQEILKLGELLGKSREAKKVADQFERKINSFRNSFNGERALFIIWHEPLTVAGESSHIGEIMRLIGLKNIANNSLPYYSMNIEQIIKANPEVIYIGLGHKLNLNSLLLKLKDTKAVKDGKVFMIGDSIYHLSPRLLHGIREMVQWKR